MGRLDNTRDVRRVVILGPGAAGKSTLARRLGEVTGLEVIELDKHFWRAGLVATPAEEWAVIQGELAARPGWIMDGDLGPYDVLKPRLKAADTVVVLDVARWRCLWRAVRRSPERADFWKWLWSWHRLYRPQMLRAIEREAPGASLRIVRTAADADHLLSDAATRG